MTKRLPIYLSADELEQIWNDSSPDSDSDLMAYIWDLAGELRENELYGPDSE